MFLKFLGALSVFVLCIKGPMIICFMHRGLKVINIFSELKHRSKASDLLEENSALKLTNQVGSQAKLTFGQSDVRDLSLCSK